MDEKKKILPININKQREANQFIPLLKVSRLVTAHRQTKLEVNKCVKKEVFKLISNSDSSTVGKKHALDTSTSATQS